MLKSNLYFLSHEFTPNQVLNTSNPDYSLLSTHEVSFQDLNQKSTPPTLLENGFQKLTIPKNSTLFKLLNTQQTKVDFFEPQHTWIEKKLRNALADFIESQKNTLELNFDQAVALDAVYRTTDHQTKNVFKPIYLAHLDFTGEDLDTLSFFSDRWWVAIKDRLSHPNDLYSLNQQFSISGMINFWFPLHSISAFNTLALMDYQTLNARHHVTQYTAVRRNGSHFLACGVKHHKSQKWYFSSQLNYGEGYVFYSKKTPHSAVQFNKLAACQRQSIESRILLLKSK